MFWVAGDYLISPKVYNEFSPGNTGSSGSFAGRGGFAFSLGSLPIMAEADYRVYAYPHNQPVLGSCQTGGAAAGTQGCVTVIGGNGQTNVPAFIARDTDVDGRAGIGIGIPQVYIVGSYLTRWGNYGYPNQTGFGGGLEVLPNLRNVLSVYGSALYYPTVGGTFVSPGGTSFKLAYRILRYNAGIALSIPSTPIFVEGGFLGDSGTNSTNAPGGFSHNSIYAGLGIHF